jgi:uncharacterized protein DUF5672
VLGDVTLVAATSVALEATIEALESSMAQAEFSHVLLLSDRSPPPRTDSRIIWRRIEALRSRADYSDFMLAGLADHIASSHALCIQWDGFVLNGRAWDERFLEYDYVGAVWPQFGDGRNVGNGGFSLRSRRLLEACRDLLPTGEAVAEDLAICRVHRDVLEEQGLRFAPEEVARAFSYERTAPVGEEFGFHGAFNLVRHMPAAKAVKLFGTLEPDILTIGEHLEIVRWAMTRGRGRLALVMIARLLDRQAHRQRARG